MGQNHKQQNCSTRGQNQVVERYILLVLQESKDLIGLRKHFLFFLVSKKIVLRNNENILFSPSPNRKHSKDNVTIL